MVKQQHTKNSIQKNTPVIDFPFLSGVLALDLVNTEVIVRGRNYDLLSSPDEVARWWQQAVIHHPDMQKVKAETQTSTWNPSIVESIKQLRKAIRTLSTDLVEQQPLNREALAILNSILAMGYPALEIHSEEMVPIYRTRQPEPGVILLPIALSALQLFTKAEKHRLHKCKNNRCILFFYDNTKSATRHWCSLECMNRARSLQHYQLIKESRSLRQ
jgi:predicted RNA-binding Zn ribbon-like protein